MNLLLETLERKNSPFVSLSCKKVFPESMNWLFSPKIIFWSHLLNLESYHESYDGRKLINFGG